MLMIDPPIPARFNGIAAFAREHQWHLTVANRLVHAQSGWHGDGALITVRNDHEDPQNLTALTNRRSNGCLRHARPGNVATETS